MAITSGPDQGCRAGYVCLMTPEAAWPAVCRIKPERLMSAMVSPPIVQLAFGFGNLTCAHCLSVSGERPRACQAKPATEDMDMFARKGVFSSIGRAAVMSTVAAVALTAVEPSLAPAGSAPSGQGLSAATATSGATDFSARRRYYRGGGGGAAAAAAFAGIVGTGLAIAATQNRRAYYDDYYGGGPVYYGGGPVYYGGDPYYGGYGYGSGVPYYRGHPLAGW